MVAALKFYIKNIVLSGVIVAVSVFAHANCAGAPEISDGRVKAVRSLVVGESSTVDFHLYAEAEGTETKAKFLLYSIAKSSDAPATMYLAASTNQEEEEQILFTHDVKYYVPPFARPPVVADNKPDGPVKAAPVPPSSLIFDGCLNTFTISPKRQGIHLNLFAKSTSTKVEGANDVLLVLLENNFIEPVLELTRTSFIAPEGRHAAQVDSEIALLPSTTGVTEVIWKQFTRQAMTRVMMGEFTQNTIYRWEDKGFKKTGTLTTSELKERMKTAVKLSRCNSIMQIRFEDKIPGPNQPAP